MRSRCGAAARGRRTSIHTSAFAPPSPRRRADEGASRAEPQRAQRIARDRRFVVGAFLLADDDRALVPLSREDHRVAWCREPYGLTDRLAAIVDHQIVGATPLPGADRAGLDLLEDL